MQEQDGGKLQETESPFVPFLNPSNVELGSVEILIAVRSVP